MSTELLAIDLSSLAYPIWHMAQSSTDPNATATQVVDRVRALACNHPHTIVCCDSGPTFRHALDPTYKAQRPEHDAVLGHQLTLAKEQLVRDGFPVWTVKGFEADDLIASAAAQTLAIDGTRFAVATADKDLAQLLANDRVTLISLKDGSRLDATWVQEKFGVTPAQMTDYQCLVGDSSDNIKGAKGIGPKTAATLLTTFGSLDALYAALDSGEAKLTPSLVTSLTEFRPRLPLVRQLITLRTDVEIPLSEVAAERTPHDAAPFIEDQEEIVDEPVEPAPAVSAPPPPTPVGAAARTVGDAVTDPSVPNGGDSGQLAPAPSDWRQQLEPRSMNEAAKLAQHMHAARLFSGYGSPQAVLSTILLGRELGLHALASLRAVHVIDGRHALAADAQRALVLRSGLARYFRCIERTATSCTWETLRIGDPEPVRLTYSIEQGRAAWQKDQRAWDASGWKRHAEDMLSARASSKLARLVYSDVLFALYSPSELSDDRTD